MSKAWKKRQNSDPYVKRARDEGYRARAAFKLMELDDKDHFFRGARRVVDLGSAPGSWCQVARERMGPDAQLIALDLLAMDPIPGVDFIQGDFREDEILARLEALVDGQPVDLVLSDMAPNLSGIGPSDQARSIHLAELALAFANDWLKPQGTLVIKVFQGAGFDELLTDFRRSFKTVKVRKPAASRSESREVYLVGTGRR
ncbi:RlmE family RNA methyltransferase [Wenzhouxiangella marina]|uniref:Ribosomal RNA large subunit methyltransferase E n=1 Tax=Wenzhouxiangella marina TaxID=1579979 RepID=A0A0K0XWV3_9GAMM|nr:RlmE family RNA methyltransferase [Wenzhouxiangella marina]AKS42112.1 23S rRNA methyltransferase [Wenzhouxiangella marina]MBB6086116.1 23S rRNA (uridine2552-2'-O)-methyltransferase [Wenzhouxiangella marina]